MKKRFNFTIIRKIILGFAILTSVVLVTNLLTYNKFEQNIDANERISNVYAPSIELLNDLIILVTESNSLLTNSILVDKSEFSSSRRRLDTLYKVKKQQITKDLSQYVDEWHPDEQGMYYDDINSSLDSLFSKHDFILDEIIDFEDYQNTALMFKVTTQLTENGDISKHTKRLINNINILLKIQQKNRTEYNNEMKESFSNLGAFIGWMALLLGSSMVLIGILISRTLTIPINKINTVLKLMGDGLQPEVEIMQRTDEIGEMADSLKHLIEGLKNTSKFALKIGESNFRARYKPLSEDDVLGNSLILMRENLIKANRESEIRREENFQRNWSSQGLAEFNDLIRDVRSNDVRSKTEDGKEVKIDELEQLSQAVVSKFVEYIGANLGGLFIVNDDTEDIFLELTAYYAFDRHKYLKKRIEIGETLVGQCYQENEKIHITDVPDNYVTISSGLGADKPKNVLIVPLTINEKIYGIVELASFKKIEKYQIEFVEKVGESIATAISSVKISIRTSALLSESNEKSKRLEKQEILARQNISDIETNLAVVNKELENEKNKIVVLENEKIIVISEYEQSKQTFEKQLIEEQSKSQNMFHIIDEAFPYYELTINDEYNYLNKKYLNLIGFEMNEIINKKHNSLVSRDFINTGNYKKIWDKLKQGESVALSVQYLIDGKSRIFNERFVPIVNDKKQILKIGVFCTN